VASKPPSEIARCPSDFISVSSESHIPQSAFREICGSSSTSRKRIITF